MQNKPVNNHCSIKSVQVRHTLGLGCLTCSGRLAKGSGGWTEGAAGTWELSAWVCEGQQGRGCVRFESVRTEDWMVWLVTRKGREKFRVSVGIRSLYMVTNGGELRVLICNFFNCFTGPIICIVSPKTLNPPKANNVILNFNILLLINGKW